MRWIVRLAVVCAIWLLIIGIFWFAIGGAFRRAHCNELGQQIARPTQYKNGSCYIEIAPGLFIKTTQVIYHLESVEPLQ